ncbi:type II and III secretion system protein family protein [Aromatoleum bremense]|uniref:Type II and III secretion system protein family protein n=1 Tax=Aromatoleum bremense TaxID=76115 RepID=A0ABX1NU49_9RHOO|nr:type II and III secretion system protein family protein [Aromatoleum bremense]NMG15032.1 type II and III secretion system protein family protein [Aromatoleum bremense]QTQ32260.1 Type II/III secretion system family protein [Aromatoleum bremense]
MTTNKNSSSRRLAGVGTTALIALMLSGAAQAAVTGTPVAKKPVAVAAGGGSPCGRVEIAPMVTIPVGKSSVIRPQIPVTRILLGNPENAQAARPSTEAAKDDKAAKQQTKQADGRPGVAQVDVLLLSPNEIYLLGKTVGSTNVVLVDRSGGCTALDVTVAMDVTSVQGVLATLLPNETGIKVSSAYDSLVLTGTVSDATKVDRAVEIASAYVRDGGGEDGRNVRVLNMLNVGAPQQVMLEVKVAEVSKAVLDRFGIDFTRAYAAGDGSMIRFLSGVFGGRSAVGGQVSGTVGARVGGGIVDSLSNSSATSAITAPIGNATIGGDSTTIPLISGSNSTMLSVDALKSDGLIKILAEPTVMAISGQEGSFLAGGKIFIPVSQNDGGTRTITLEEKEFGVSVKFTPTVLEGGRINLAVRPEVSELNREGVGITAPGISGLAILPSFTTRRAFTTVQLHDGQSFAIGGLIKNNTTTNIKAFPFLGEIPVLGALFRSTEFQTDRSELVFVITPRLVKPLPADYVLPTDNYVEPNRADVILRGKVEGDSPAPADRMEAMPQITDPARGGFEPK